MQKRHRCAYLRYHKSQLRSYSLLWTTKQEDLKKDCLELKHEMNEKWAQELGIWLQWDESRIAFFFSPGVWRVGCFVLQDECFWNFWILCDAEAEKLENGAI